MTPVYDLYYMYRCLHKLQKVGRWTEGLMHLDICLRNDATC